MYFTAEVADITKNPLTIGLLRAIGIMVITKDLSNLRFPDPLLKPNGTSAWRSDQFVYQSVAVFWMTEVYFIQLLQ